MPLTYEPIASTTLASNANNITFSSIPSSYTDLCLVARLTGTNNGDNTFVRLNGDTSGVYNYTYLYGDGTSPATFRGVGQTAFLVEQSGTSNTIPSLIIVNIFSYANALRKTGLSRAAYDKNGAGQVAVTSLLWTKSDAVTNISINNLFNNFITGSTATLYGILKA